MYEILYFSRIDSTCQKKKIKIDIYIYKNIDFMKLIY